MDTVYLVCAIVGGTLIVCQFVMTLFGLGGDHDMSGHDVGGHDVGGHDHTVGHDAETSWIFSVLSFRTLTAAAAFFGLTGLAASRYLDPLPASGLAVGAGALALCLVGWIMRMLTRLNVDGTVRIERAVGSSGTVYVPIPASKAGIGKVQVSVLNRTMEYNAVTSKDNLPTGAKVYVVGVVSSDTVEVASATDSERMSHV
jgi:hypothetical protein